MTQSSPPSVSAPGDTAFFAISPEESLTALDTSSDGLTSAQAQTRLEAVGPNALDAKKGKPAIVRFMMHFDDVLIYILLGSAALKAIIGDWVDFAVILAAAVIIALVGFIQEGKALDALEGIKKMLSLEARVLRDGSWVKVPSEDLVPGDIIRVSAGDRAPADVRILEATNLRVDEAALTGESEPSEKDNRSVGVDAGVGDRSSMLFSSTIVSSGTAIGVVTATGMATEIGRITAMVDEVEDMETPLAQKLGLLARRISLAIGIIALIIVVVGRVVYNMSIDDLASAAISFVVAAVPEGLPALVTITLALGVKQMASNNAITRKMTAVETLGSVTTICSDKTGTLTQNEMTVREGATRDQIFEVTGGGYSPVGNVLVDCEVVDINTHPRLAELIGAGAATSNAEIQQKDGEWTLVGAPTEGALTTLARKAGLASQSVRLAEIPFDSEHKFSASLDQMPDGSRVLHVLGAPDRIMARSNWEVDSDGTKHPVDEPGWDEYNAELASHGLRVLATASRDATDLDPKTLSLDDVQDLTFLGLFGIVDPPRPEAVAAIAKAHGAGINVKMITGDHSGTAVAIAQELGIAERDGTPAELAITGAEIEAMTQDELRQRVKDVNVFARTSPEHKIRIVRALQSRGQVVAMTGDGVNDAPSVTRADVGVAMGIKGTEATKEAADIVLADDNFATIERAVEEGRRIFDNIRKSLVFLLPTNGAQSLVILVAVLFGVTLPLAPVQILWINLITAVTLSLPLAAEPAEPGIMNRRPRDPDEPLLSARHLLIIALASVLIGGLTFGVFLYASSHGQTHAQAQTTAVTMLAFAQLAFLFSSRFINTSALTVRVLTGNRLIWLAAGIMIALQLVFVYTPFMHTWFGSASIGLRAWGLILGLSLATFLVVEAAKAALMKWLR
ncbi:cation-translocating P-type ATPase [Actinomyces minihominis]|uniref:cation-translocating P-type ATPase n=1 Tax=Actinomyces minihominis TaxID=2002838 RepID=UPI000C07B695|nr:HAD-IC family P-type ATPase [Actinomyces minihominis]